MYNRTFKTIFSIFMPNPPYKAFDFFSAIAYNIYKVTWFPYGQGFRNGRIIYLSPWDVTFFLCLFSDISMEVFPQIYSFRRDVPVSLYT